MHMGMDEEESEGGDALVELGDVTGELDDEDGSRSGCEADEGECGEEDESGSGEGDVEHASGSSSAGVSITRRLRLRFGAGCGGGERDDTSSSSSSASLLRRRLRVVPPVERADARLRVEVAS